MSAKKSVPETITEAEYHEALPHITSYATHLEDQKPAAAAETVEEDLSIPRGETLPLANEDDDYDPFEVPHVRQSYAERETQGTGRSPVAGGKL